MPTDCARARRALGALSPAAFAAAYLPHRLGPGLPGFQRGLLERLGPAVTGRGPGRVVALMPAGYGKSLLGGLVVPLWAAAYGLKRGIALVGAGAGEADALLAGLAEELSSNARLRADFAHLRRVEAFGGSVRRPVRGLRAGGVLVWAAERGRAVELPRPGAAGLAPDLVVLDDPERGHAGADPAGQRRRVALWWERQLGPLPGPDAARTLVAIGTPAHEDGLMYHLLKVSLTQPGWDRSILRAVVSYGRCPRAWARHEAVHRGVEGHLGRTGPEAAEAMLPLLGGGAFEGTLALWPERESYLDLMRLRARVGWVAFQRLRQCEVGEVGLTRLDMDTHAVTEYWHDDMGLLRRARPGRPGLDDAVPVEDAELGEMAHGLEIGSSAVVGRGP